MAQTRGFEIIMTVTLNLPSYQQVAPHQWPI